ncbi:MAG: flagellar basal body rod protein FlgC [Planctomycetota bacterium]|nr:MAG: flagellar basal body rod protein FlgC [Planctomycetota bacterium]
MNVHGLFRTLAASASGMRAERTRMDVISQNIANAEVTKGPDGEPYRRREVVFESVLDNALADSGAGVEVAGIETDPTPFPRVFRPGHPDADADGYVRMPNVSLPMEMVDLIAASRAYEANLAAMRSYRDMVQQGLQIGR